MNYTNPINQSGNESKSEKRIDLMDDVNAYIELIKENIEYEHYMKYDDWQNRALYEELFEVIWSVIKQVVLIISFIGFWSAVLMASEKCVCFLCQRILELQEVWES